MAQFLCIIVHNNYADTRCATIIMHVIIMFLTLMLQFLQQLLLLFILICYSTHLVLNTYDLFPENPAQQYLAFLLAPRLFKFLQMTVSFSMIQYRLPTGIRA